MRNRCNILGIEIDTINFQQAIDQVAEWGKANQSAYVCFANVHMTMEAASDPQFATIINNADLLLPDGKPIAASVRWLYGKRQERIAGMDFMPSILNHSINRGLKIFLYGSTESLLLQLKSKISKEYSENLIAGTYSPPFRPLSPEEEQQSIDSINQSGANLVLVALGCPKQEKWMARHSKQIHAPLLGLGGAFAVVAGLQKRSPLWMQKNGLEWVFRLYQEPGRLLRRYFVTNTRFVFHLLMALLKKK